MCVLLYVARDSNGDRPRWAGVEGWTIINRTINQGPLILDLRLRWAVCPIALALCTSLAPCYYFPAVPKLKAGDQDADAHIVLYCVPHIYDVYVFYFFSITNTILSRLVYLGRRLFCT